MQPQNRESSRLVVTMMESSTMGNCCCWFDDRLMEAIRRQIPCLIVTLLTLVMVNLSLILWIVFAMNLHQNSPFVRKSSGETRVQANLEVSNRTVFHADFLEYFPGSRSDDEDREPLKLIPGKNVDSLEIESEPNKLRLTTAGDLELKINHFTIETDKPFKRKFHLDSERMKLTVSDSGIDHLDQQPGGLQMSELHAETISGSVNENEFRLESRRECLDIVADTENVQLDSVNGPLQMDSHDDIEIDAEQHLSLDGRGIFLPNLELGHHHHHHHHYRHNDEPEAYQVCICQNGIIFAIPDNHFNHCQADQSICNLTTTTTESI